MPKYSIIDGKLYADGELAQIEFGNADLIKYIKERNRIAELAITDGIPLNIDVEHIYRVNASFKCVCGSSVYLESEDEFEDDAINELKGKAKCRNCKQEYEVKQDEDGDLIALPI